MSKNRSINSGIRMSQTFGKLSYRQRDLWHGIISVADDQGRLPGVPAAIRSLVWPYDDISLDDIEADLQKLIESNNILIYDFEGKRFLQIVNWWKYQSPQWAGESNYPPPEGWLDRTRYHTAGRKILTKNWDTPGGFAIRILSDGVNDKEKVNEKDNEDVNNNALSQSDTTKVCDKGSQSNEYQKLLTAFINKSKLPLFGNMKPRDNEALVKMVSEGCTPADIEEAIDYNTKNKLALVGPASVLNGTMIAMANRKRNGETVRVGDDYGSWNEQD